MIPSPLDLHWEETDEFMKVKEEQDYICDYMHRLLNLSLFPNSSIYADFE